MLSVRYHGPLSMGQKFSRICLLQGTIGQNSLYLTDLSESRSINIGQISNLGSKWNLKVLINEKIEIMNFKSSICQSRRVSLSSGQFCGKSERRVYFYRCSGNRNFDRICGGQTFWLSEKSWSAQNFFVRHGIGFRDRKSINY